MRLLDWLIIIGLGAGFGSSLFFNAILVRELGPLTISAFRVSLGAIAVWILIAITGRSVRLTFLQVIQCVVLGVFMFAIPFAVYPLSLGYVTSGMVAIVNALTPAAVVIVSHFWPGGERATWHKGLGVTLGLLGIAFLSVPALLSEGSSEILGIACTLLAPLSFAVAMNYFRRLSGTDIAVMTATAMTGATVFLVPFVLVIEGLPVISAPASYGSLLVLGPILTGLFFLAGLWMTRRVGATNTSILTFISPVVTLLLGLAFLNEAIEMMQLIGMATIFAGLLIIDGGLLARFGLRVRSS
jgi:drug/metabolite transporter (DMT)-like permease